MADLAWLGMIYGMDQRLIDFPAPYQLIDIFSILELIILDQIYLNFRLLLFRTFFSYFPILDLLILDQINFYLGFYYLVRFLYFLFSVMSYK